MGFCEKFLNAGTEKLGSHREKNRYAAFMWPKAAGSDFLLFLIYLLVCSQNITTCEFAPFWAQIWRAVAANTVGLQACSLYKKKTLGHSLTWFFHEFWYSFLQRSYRCLNLRSHWYCLRKERFLYCILRRIATYILHQVWTIRGEQLQCRQNGSNLFYLSYKGYRPSRGTHHALRYAKAKAWFTYIL